MTEKEENNTGYRANRLFAIGITVLVAAAVIGGIAGTAIIRKAKKTSENRRKEWVLKIGGKGVSREVFELFCITVIESPEFASLEAAASSDKELASLVKKKASLYAQQYYALRTEAENSGITLSRAEKADVDHSVETVSKSGADDSFFVANFGVTKSGYRDVLYGWKLCEKYIESAADNADTSEETLRLIFEENAVKLGKARADVIYFDTSSNDQGSKNLKNSLASDIANTINGVPDQDKEKIFKSYYNNYNEEGFDSSGLNVMLTGDIAEDYPVLFEAVKKAAENHCYAVDDGVGVFVVRVRERFMFEYYRDTPEFKAIVRDHLLAKIASDAVNSGKYEITETKATDSVDIGALISGRKKLNGR